jgi:hypothetical protein
LLLFFVFLFVICVYLVFKRHANKNVNLENSLIIISFMSFFWPFYGTLITWRLLFINEIANKIMILIPLCLIYMFYMIAKRLLNLANIDLYSLIFLNFITNFLLITFGFAENRYVIVFTILFSMAIYYLNMFYIFSGIKRFILFIHKCFKHILSKNNQVRDIQINIIRTIIFTGISLLSII